MFHGRHFVRHLGICNLICIKHLQIMCGVIRFVVPGGPTCGGGNHCSRWNRRSRPQVEDHHAPCVVRAATSQPRGRQPGHHDCQHLPTAIKSQVHVPRRAQQHSVFLSPARKYACFSAVISIYQGREMVSSTKTSWQRLSNSAWNNM